MKSILEKALVHLLNEENEKAQELMHQFVVERAKDIHESLREGDEMDMENLEEAALEEEFFTEADLEDAEAADHIEDDLDDGSVSDEDLGGDDMSSEGDMPAEGDMDADASVDADMDGEAAPDMDERLDDIEDEIKSLQAEFDKIMAEFDGGSDDDASAEDDMSVADAPADGAAVSQDEEDFDDITESMVDDLKKVSTPNDDGKGANGEKLGHPEYDSPIAKDAKNTVLASKNTVGHTGWERETPPSKKDGPDRGRKYDNNRSKATDGNGSVPATGPKAATLSKPVAGNNKSIIPGGKVKKG